jgi:hypothetical protein
MEMFTSGKTEIAEKQIGGVRSSGAMDDRKMDVLRRRLLRAQPQSEPLLKRLLARTHRAGRPRAFAPIQDGRCSACNMTVAIARIQKAKAGEFINCATCTIFLYYYDPS